MLADIPEWVQWVQAAETLPCSLFDLLPRPETDVERREWLTIASIWGQFKGWREERAYNSAKG